MKAYPLVTSVAALLVLASCGGEPQKTAAAPMPSIVAEVAVAAAPALDGVQAEGEQAALAVGSAAPDFELPGSDGNSHKLSDFAGQHVVLAFFPKAFTGG